MPYYRLEIEMMNRKITLLDLGGVVFQSTRKTTRQVKWEIIRELSDRYGFELNIGKDKFPKFLSEYNEITNQNLSEKELLYLSLTLWN